MDKISLLLFLALFAFAGPFVFCRKIVGPLDDQCLKCICEGATACDEKFECERDICGMYGLVKPLWVAGGKVVVREDNPDDPKSWVNCALNKDCSIKTLQQYFQKNQRDCNGDGVINCIDFAAVHQLGLYRCASREYWDMGFEQRFGNCLQKLGGLSGVRIS